MCKPIIAFSLIAKAQNMSIHETSHEELKALASEATPLITEEDIVAYSDEYAWSPFHQMKLRSECASRLAQHSTQTGTPFVVTVYGEPIYFGVLMTANSAYPSNLPTILVDPKDGDADEPSFWIDRNHPHRGEEGDDPRRDDRLMQVLHQLRLVQTVQAKWWSAVGSDCA